MLLRLNKSRFFSHVESTVILQHTGRNYSSLNPKVCFDLLNKNNQLFSSDTGWSPLMTCTPQKQCDIVHNSEL